MVRVITSLFAVVAITFDGASGARDRIHSTAAREIRTAHASNVGVGTVLMNRYEIVQLLSAPESYWSRLRTFLFGRRRKQATRGKVADIPLDVRITENEAREKFAGRHSSLVGDGAYGQVYRAFDKKFNVNVVIKILKRATIREKPEAIQELSDECSITNMLQQDTLGDSEGASRLLKCYFNAAETNYHMIVLEDAGDELYNYLVNVKKRSKSSDWVKLKSLHVRKMFKQILQGVKFMSRKHVWHLDLKPGNIAVQDVEEGDVAVKIIDFGFANVQPKTLGKNDKVMTYSRFGSYIYAPPEVRQYHIAIENETKQTGHLSRETLELLTNRLEQAVLASVEAFDLWSVGVSLLQLVCGEGLDRRKDFRRTKSDILPALFPAFAPPESGNYTQHIDAVLTEQGCWESHQKDEVTLNILKATLNIDPAQRYFPY